MHHRGRVVPQSELTDHIYAINADRDSNTIEVFVARLRRKLGAGVIETVRGLGYRVAAERRRGELPSRPAAAGRRPVDARPHRRLPDHRGGDSTRSGTRCHAPRARRDLPVAIAVGCMVIGFSVMRRALVPLDNLRRRLSDVQKGVERRLHGSYPAEVQPLVDDLNALLTHERAGDRAGDRESGRPGPRAEDAAGRAVERSRSARGRTAIRSSRPRSRSRSR